MKKYMIPKATCINLSGEESLLLTGSVYGSEDTEVMTQKQENNPSIWDSWSE